MAVMTATSSDSEDCVNLFKHGETGRAARALFVDGL